MQSSTLAKYAPNDKKGKSPNPTQPAVHALAKLSQISPLYDCPMTIPKTGNPSPQHTISSGLSTNMPYIRDKKKTEITP